MKQCIEVNIKKWKTDLYLLGMFLIMTVVLVSLGPDSTMAPSLIRNLVSCFFACFPFQCLLLGTCCCCCCCCCCLVVVPTTTVVSQLCFLLRFLCVGPCEECWTSTSPVKLIDPISASIDPVLLWLPGDFFWEECKRGAAKRRRGEGGNGGGGGGTLKGVVSEGGEWWKNLRVWPPGLLNSITTCLPNLWFFFHGVSLNSFMGPIYGFWLNQPPTNFI